MDWGKPRAELDRHPTGQRTPQKGEDGLELDRTPAKFLGWIHRRAVQITNQLQLKYKNLKENMPCGVILASCYQNIIWGCSMSLLSSVERKCPVNPLREVGHYYERAIITALALLTPDFVSSGVLGWKEWELWNEASLCLNLTSSWTDDSISIKLDFRICKTGTVLSALTGCYKD